MDMGELEGRKGGGQMELNAQVVVGLCLIAAGIGFLKAYWDVRRWSKCFRRHGRMG